MVTVTLIILGGGVIGFVNVMAGVRIGEGRSKSTSRRLKFDYEMELDRVIQEFSRELERQDPSYGLTPVDMFDRALGEGRR
jgi:hypothetical protein